MRKLALSLLVFVLGGILLFGVMSARVAQAGGVLNFMPAIQAGSRAPVFRQKTGHHSKGYDHTVMLVKYRGVARTVITSYSNLAKPGEKDWPRIYQVIDKYQSLLSWARKVPGQEDWDVYQKPAGHYLFKGFIDPERIVVYRSISKHHRKKGYHYSVAVAWYADAWHILVTSYDERSWVTENEWPGLHQVINSMQLPPPGTPGKNGDIWKNQFVGHY